MFYLQTEEKRGAELLEAQLDAEHRSRVFAADPQRYITLYAEEDSPENEIEGDIVEIDPEDERQVRLMVNEMRRRGHKFAE